MATAEKRLNPEGPREGRLLIPIIGIDPLILPRKWNDSFNSNEGVTKMAVMATDVQVPIEAISLTPLIEARMEIAIIGLSPVIPHRWTDKSKRMMLDKQQGKPTLQKAPKNPEEEADAATYWLKNGSPGMPATAFKAASADAARYFDKRITIELLKRALFVYGDGADQLVAIEGELTMREDTPRNSGGTADLRYRNQVWPWSATLDIGYLEAVLTPDAVLALVDAGGRGGVGDWRPSSPRSKTGTFGRYRVEQLS